MESTLHSEVNTLASLIKLNARTEHLTRLDPRGILDLARSIQVEDDVIVVDKTCWGLSRHNHTPRCVVRGDNIGAIIHANLNCRRGIFRQLELAASVIHHLSLCQSYKDTIWELKSQRTLCLIVAPTLKRASGVVTLCPLCKVCQGSLGKCEASALASDVSEETIHRLGEVVSECNTLVIGSHIDVEKVYLTLIARCTLRIVIVITFEELKCHLIILILDLGTLAIGRSPALIHARLLYADKTQVLTPKIKILTRNTQS